MKSADDGSNRFTAVAVLPRPFCRALVLVLVLVALGAPLVLVALGAPLELLASPTNTKLADDRRSRLTVAGTLLDGETLTTPRHQTHRCNTNITIPTVVLASSSYNDYNDHSDDA